MGTGYKILIVDDDPDFVEATRAVLRSEGYQVASAHDGEEALTAMRKDRPDLVLLDVIMNWPLEGTRISRVMMSSAELRDIPIVMCTSILGSEYRGLFPQDEYLHIDGWLDKPCSPQRLLDEIASVLERHARYRESS